MDDFASVYIEGAEIAAEQKVKEAQFDSTIQAKIISCEDQSRGKYKVKYQDSIFIAYAEEEKTYTPKTDVYILVPSNDFSKTKKIIGSVNNLPTDYVSVVMGTEGSFDKVGTDIIEDSGEYSLISALSYDSTKNSIVLYDAGKKDNLIKVNEEVAKEYMSTSEYFIMAASFRTALAESQKSRGVYSYKIRIEYTDNASGETKYRDHILSSLEMTGQPYTFLEKTRQFKAFQYTDLTYVRISKVEFLCEDFPKEGIAVDDLFITDLEFYAAKPIPQEELTSYHITLLTPEGSIFVRNTATKKLPIQAIFKVDGKVVESASLDFFWFLQDNTIGTESERYNRYGGVGWRCLNDYKEIIDETTGFTDKQWISKGISEYNIYKNKLPVEYSTIKCVIPYNDVLTNATQEIINRDCNYKVSIWSDQINDKGTIEWHNDVGETDLKCITLRSDVEITSNLSYKWGKQDAYGNTVPINPEVDPKEYDKWVDYVLKAEEYIAHNPGIFFEEQYPLYDEYKAKIEAYRNQTRIDGQWLRNVKAIDIDTMATYIVTVTYTNQETQEEMVIGTAKLIITNGKSSGGYILNIEKPPLFKYDANGVSPASDSQGSQKLIITPLSFVLLDSNGTVLSDLAKLTNFNIKWRIPAENTMIVMTDPSATLNEDETEFYINNKTSIIYGIADVFSVGKNNNTIKLELTSKTDANIFMQAFVTLMFTKEGGLGTNGTEYNITIDLLQTHPNSYTDRKDIPIVKITNYKISPSITPINFATENARWLKFTLWKNGEKIFEGTDKNTLPGYDDSMKTTEGIDISNLKWQMLSSKSYYYVSPDGKFSSSGQFDLNPCNIVKISFSYKGIYYSSCLPIVTLLVDNEEYISAPQIGGFIEAVYGPDGTGPLWDQTNPFQIKSFKTDKTEVTNILEYKWDLGGDIPNLTFDDKKNVLINEKWATPNSILVSSLADNSIICYIGEKEWYPDPTWQIDHPMGEMTPDESIIFDEFQEKVDQIQKNTGYTEEEKEQMIQAQVQLYKKVLPFYLNVFNTIHFPIHMLLNRYGFAAINDWDGNLYTLNDEKDVLLIPQVGAGRKENDNSFTGMVMGTIDVRKKKTCEVGLFGYNKGERTFFLDGQTGKVALGLNSSQIVIDPTSKSGQATISANYSKTSKTGMLIDLTNPSIIYGNGMFSVDEEGHLIAQKAEISGIIKAEELDAEGCFVGNFEISKTALLMNAQSSFRELYYDWETHEWDFDKVIVDDNESEEEPTNDPETKYQRMRAAADIYFGKLGLNIGRVTEESDKPFFQVRTDGRMYCKQAYISNAAEVSTHKILSNKILIDEGGSIEYANKNFFIDENGVGQIEELTCKVLHADIINPEGEVSRALVGTDLTLNKGTHTYFSIDSENGIKASKLDYEGNVIKCNELNINNNCRFYSDGKIMAREVEADKLVVNKLDLNDYVFTSSAEISIQGKDLGNLAIQRGRILSFVSDIMGSDIDVVPHITGWIPKNEADGTCFAEEPYLELFSGYKILLNALDSVDIQTSGHGKVSFTHEGVVEETGESVVEPYAEISVEGLKLHKGGDTLVSMLDGTYNIPYPPAGMTYDKIFSMDGYLFNTIYVSDPTEQQSIDLTSAFGSVKPEDISVQLCITINLKGIVASVSEIEEYEPDDETKKVRNFYINYNKVPTKEEFGGEAISLHWTAFFFKKN